MSIHIIVDFDLLPQHRDITLDAFAALQKATLTEPGCVVFDLFEPSATPNGLILVEEWVDQTAIDHHMTLDHTIEFRRIVEPCFASPPAARTIIPRPTNPMKS